MKRIRVKTFKEIGSEPNLERVFKEKRLAVLPMHIFGDVVTTDKENPMVGDWLIKAHNPFTKHYEHWFIPEEICEVLE